MAIRSVLHVAPHPDDELLGAPASLFALRDAGWRVVNLACSLGRPEQRERRLAELQEACARAGYELLVELEPAAALAAVAPALVVAPSPFDDHPAHRRAARATLAAVAAAGAPDRVWLWALYADLRSPTLLRPVAQPRIDEIEHALAAHAGELERNDYRRALRGRLELNAVVGPERLFGFGSQGLDATRAELLTELALVEGRFVLCAPRVAESDELGTPAEPRTLFGSAGPGS